MENIFEKLGDILNPQNTKTMNTQDNTIGKTLVAFHIGRGGRFHNAGHKIFIGQDKSINEFTSDLFETYENVYDVARQIGERENLLELLQKANEDDANAYNRLKKWGLDLGQKVHTTCGGYDTGLYVENDGTGEIDIDGEYNTTIVRRLEDCSEDECMIILKNCGCDEVENSVYNGYAEQEVIDWCLEVCGIEIKNNLNLANESVGKLNHLYKEPIFCVKYGSNRESATIINDKYRYEGNDVDIVFDSDGIEGSITSKSIKFDDIDDLIDNIGQLFNITAI